MVGMTVKKKTRSNNKPDAETKGRLLSTSSPTKLSAEYIEKHLMEALDKQPGNANLIGKATEFYLKVLIKSDAMEDDIDMEALKNIGIVAKSGD